MNVLKWLHDNGCPWDATVCAYAAKYGQFEMLKYLLQNGCPIDDRAIKYATDEGHSVIVNWLQKI